MSATPEPVIHPDFTVLDEDLGPDHAAVIRSLATRLADAGRVSDVDAFVEAVLVREALGSTVLPRGIAMPHARSAAVVTPSIAVARLPKRVAFAEGAEPVRIVLLIAAPGDDSAGYLALLQKVAGAAVRNSFVSEVTDARSSAGLAEVALAAIEQR